MKIIRITTDAIISTHEFPENVSYTELNDYLRGLIGKQCELYETVPMEKLYSSIGASKNITDKKGEAIICLVDESGMYHDLDINVIGSYLYGMNTHGQPILGTLLIVGMYYGNDGIEFSGLSDEQFNIVYPVLDAMCKSCILLDSIQGNSF